MEDSRGRLSCHHASHVATAAVTAITGLENGNLQHLQRRDRSEEPFGMINIISCSSAPKIMKMSTRGFLL